MNMLERLKELEKQATPGPWKVHSEYPWVVSSLEPAKLGSGNIYFSCTCGGANNEENARYLAEVLNALPPLLEVVEAGDELATAVREWAMDENNTTINDCVVLAIRYQQTLAKLEEVQG